MTASIKFISHHSFNGVILRDCGVIDEETRSTTSAAEDQTSFTIIDESNPSTLHPIIPDTTTTIIDHLHLGHTQQNRTKTIRSSGA
jgi:hypothetical protein